jgi:predicted CXXCH cytochrome family protein
MRSSSSIFAVLTAAALAIPSGARARPAPAASASAQPATAGPNQQASKGAPPAGKRHVWTASDQHARERVDTNTCATCHGSLAKPALEKPAEQFATSVHADDRIGCVGCHQGDPKDPTVGAHDWDGGFTARPGHTDVVALCGRCHSNAAFIRRFNARLHTDQAELFPLSLHGRLAAAGDENAPTCTTCHGTHDILPVASLQAPVQRKNVAKLCAKCHADKKRMAPYGLPTHQLARWERSGHARALRAGNASAPTCTGCHGPHSATPPRANSVGRICGHCHEEQFDAFRKSPHSKPFKRLGFSECVPCHDPHEARRATWLVDSPDSACNRCHADGGRPSKVAAELAHSVRSARERVRKTREMLGSATERRLTIPGAAEALDALVSEESRLSVMVHSLDPTRLKEPLGAVARAADRIDALVAKAEGARQLRRRGYYVAVALALVLFGLLLAKSIRLARRRRRGKT